MRMFGRDKWRHADLDGYSISYYEVEFPDGESEGGETRRINIYRDGDIRYAFDEWRNDVCYEVSSGRSTSMGDQPVRRSAFATWKDSRLANEAAFERLWSIALRRHPVAWRTPLYGATQPHPDDERSKNWT